jgi:hypothetical protein
MADLETLPRLIEIGPDGTHPDASPDRLKSFKFDIGDCTAGPLGCVIRVQAYTVDEAVGFADRAWPEYHEVDTPEISACAGEDEVGIEYLTVYFNDALDYAEHITEWEYVFDDDTE